MLNKIRFAFIATLGMFATLQAGHALAGVQTWDFDSSTQSFSSGNFGNTLSLTSPDGVGLTVSGWSDTWDITGDDLIQDARLLWAQSAALGVQNRDEGTGSPNHSIDSVTSDVDGEFDMLLLEFDTAVNLTGIDLGWARGGGGSGLTDVSLLAWDGVGSDTLAGNTWADVLSSNGGGYDSVGNYAGVGLSYYAVNPSNVESTIRHRSTPGPAGTPPACATAVSSRFE